MTIVNDSNQPDIPPKPKETVEIELTILEERKGELEVPDYLFNKFEVFD